MIDDTRLEALAAAKLAVRAYAKDPTAGNASRVETAWQLLRRLDAVAVWRRRSQMPSSQMPPRALQPVTAER